MIEPKRRCKVAVWKRDTYRRDGRAKSGFSMHYNMVQCSRAVVKNDRCWQHQVERFGNGTLIGWHEFVERAVPDKTEGER